MSTKRYDKEFKETAVKLVKGTNKTVPELAKELGISDVTLYEWVRAYNKTSTPEFPGSGNASAEKKEIIELKKQLADAREEAEILKKAMAFFVNPRK
jgi:transposase